MNLHRRQPTDGERFKIAVSKMEKLKEEMKSDPWGFIGSVILTYHGAREGAKRGGDLATFEKYESDLLSKVSYDFPPEFPDKRETPYK